MCDQRHVVVDWYRAKFFANRHADLRRMSGLLMSQSGPAPSCVDSSTHQNFAHLVSCHACGGAPVEIVHNIIPLEYADAVRDYARGNLDEPELWAELSALGYNAFETEWHIANPGQRME